MSARPPETRAPAPSAATRVGVFAAIWSLAILLGRFVGFVRETVIGRTLGVSAQADVYFTAFTIPDFFNYLLAGGALSLTFIPIFGRHLAEGREDRGWDSFSDIANFLLLVGLPLTLAVGWAMPHLGPRVAGGFDEDQLALLTRLTRIILPGQVFILLGALLQATLQARDRHVVPALAPSAYTLFIIAFGLALHRRLGAEGFAWGVLAGAAIGSFGVPLVACWRAGMRWKLRLRLGNPDFRRYLLLSLPIMVGQSIVAVDPWLWKWQGSFLDEGAVSWLNYAKTLRDVPSGVFGLAAGAAAYPTLVRLTSEGRHAESHELLIRAAKLTLLLAFLSQALLTVLGEDAIRLVWGFSNPRFGPADVRGAADCLSLFALALGAWSLHPLLARGFYAAGNTWTPTIIGTGVTLAVIPLYVVLRTTAGAPGLALASSLALACYIVPLYLWLRRRARAAAGPATPLPGFRGFLLRSVGVLLLTTGGAFALHSALSRALPADSPAAVLARLVLVGAATVPLFLGACRLAGIEEARALTDRARGVVRRLGARWSRRRG
ncbi:murein biosynthesis integral membrane protein MurJ [Myxococcota bacterium]|nr:murein biosynthesis integral membrane protein MurJ [Myxococcota bacterium]